MNFLAKLFHNTIDTSEVDAVERNIKVGHQRILSFVRLNNALTDENNKLRAALVTIRSQGISSPSATARAMAQQAAEALT